ncbi:MULTISPECIES: hypothetical protein [Paenibacillus]|uniref:hypothetical protein n=1 Tax=Paenibacillus TaxID=44249 RepID=UPI0020005844|nr:hypothetical protein [Paenibacillus pabuli]UPK46106.1 hypothetical protein KET34_11960 [Paenibacillus pabuli]
MLIILAVIVVIGVVFLMIYNSRSSRKAAEARASKIAEVDEGPVLLHEEDQTRNEDRSYEQTEHTEVLGHEEYKQQTDIYQTDSTSEVTPLPQKRETQTTDGDQAYRQALLHFRKPAEVKEEAVRTDTNEPEKSADEVYRSALKVMKSKSSDPSSKRK